MAMDLLQVAIIRSYIYNARIMLDWRYVCKLFECDFTIELQNVSALSKIDSNVEKSSRWILPTQNKTTYTSFIFIFISSFVMQQE